ncbi:hypothetical protein GDO78_004765 [Eleutherodactylus coqui]|uniref:Uncharacterized protein n=1 Tax=Eleutherodactylus coqui TaxID=57060 RepID=A0A8J6K442_ELECQ|nr:hypothetical protein GDO78_004765 [Eleutherodactylus coqui]
MSITSYEPPPCSMSCDRTHRGLNNSTPGSGFPGIMVSNLPLHSAISMCVQSAEATTRTGLMPTQNYPSVRGKKCTLRLIVKGLFQSDMKTPPNCTYIFGYKEGRSSIVVLFLYIGEVL